MISIVGYTNAGKSTLLNSLIESEVLVEDKLFATLDPTSRRLRFPRQREVIVTDTVGFIRDLPEDLVDAFRATLEELDDADLLLHVADVSDPDLDDHVAAVERILGNLGLSDTPRLLVLNEIDRLPAGEGDAMAVARAASPSRPPRAPGSRNCSTAATRSSGATAGSRWPTCLAAPTRAIPGRRASFPPRPGGCARDPGCRPAPCGPSPRPRSRPRPALETGIPMPAHPDVRGENPAPTRFSRR